MSHLPQYNEHKIMKKVKREGGAGLQDWLSYQARTREAVRPETDTIDWDEGIEVQEEWLTREQCEQRLRDEVERKLVPAAKSSSAPASTPVVEVEDIALTSLVPAATTPISTVDTTKLAAAEINEPIENEAVEIKSAQTRLPEIRENSLRDTSSREIKGKPPAPAQFETDDLASAVPAFHR